MRIPFITFVLWLIVSPMWPQSGFKPEIPKVWDDDALSDWATPIAGLNLRPKHISAKKYYSLPEDNLRTYPVYTPGREPEGYWKMLHRVGPKPLIEPAKLKSRADWIEAGRRVFDEADFIHLRTYDPKYIREIRSPNSPPHALLPTAQCQVCAGYLRNAASHSPS
jgi:hypothetical protein